MKIKKTAEDYAIDIFAYLFMGFCAIITLVPVINLFSKAVSDRQRSPPERSACCQWGSSWIPSNRW